MSGNRPRKGGLGFEKQGGEEGGGGLIRQHRRGGRGRVGGGRGLDYLNKDLLVECIVMDLIGSNCRINEKPAGGSNKTRQANKSVADGPADEDRPLS